MKIHFLFLLILAIIFLNSCATTRNIELTAVASPDQKTGPYGAIVSEKRHMVSIVQYKEIYFMKDNAIFNIIIENGEEEPLTIGNEDISMIFEEHDKKHTVKKLDVQSAAELMQDVDYEYRKRLISGLVEINRENDSIAAYSPVAGGMERSILIFPNYNRKNFLLSRVSKIEGNNINIKTLRESFPDLILSQKTIMPSESISILISCRTSDIPRRIKGDLKITVSIDGEEHGFIFRRK